MVYLHEISKNKPKLIVKFFKELKKQLPNAVVLIGEITRSIIKHWQTTEPHLLCLNFYFFNELSVRY